MRDSTLRLNDKTVLLHGGTNSVVQSIASFLTEQGSDVAIVGEKAATLRKFTDNLMDNRQVHQNFGRATTIEMNIQNEVDCTDAITRVAESFGAIDAFIDASLFDKPAPFRNPENAKSLAEICKSTLLTPILMAHSALKFLESRNRGRIVFLLKDASISGLEGEAVASAARGGIRSLIATLSREVKERNVTVNGVSVGFTEETVLNRFPQGSIREGLEKLKAQYPNADLVEPQEVAATVGFLISPLAQGISGQIIRVNRAFATY